MAYFSILHSFIRESLLTEEVFGAQAFVYHGSWAQPSKLINDLIKNKFNPSESTLYGKGIYTVYDLKNSATANGEYGNYIYKLKINLYGFIIFDPDVAVKVYGKPLTPAEQARMLGKPQLEKKLFALAKKLDDFVTTGEIGVTEFTSEHALEASKFLAGKVKGIVYTGSSDGRCALLYDPAVAVPVSWMDLKKGDSKWIHVDRSALGPSLQRSSMDSWEVGRFDPVFQLKQLAKLPVEERVINGDLRISKTDLKTLPAGLKVKGSLILPESMASLPEGLEIENNLYADDTKIKSLPNDIKVKGILSLSGCHIESLPANLKCKNLYIERTPITSLPDDIQVERSIYAKKSKIRKLPDNLKIAGDLDLTSTPIAKLPAGLTVGGVVWLSKTKVEKLPPDMFVGVEIVPAIYQRSYEKMKA